MREIRTVGISGSCRSWVGLNIDLIGFLPDFGLFGWKGEGEGVEGSRVELGSVWLGVKYFPGVKYFQERKIFSSAWLHLKNYIRKQFSVFGNILKMLFSYKFFTLS